MADGFPGVVLSEAVEPADWIRAVLSPWANGPSSVSALVPADYPAHGRILHRAGNTSGPVRWSEIAALTGQTIRADTRYNELVGWNHDADHQQPPPPWGRPDAGSLQPEECAAVADVLARFTTTPNDCWFCLWEGYGTGWPVLNRLADWAPRVALEHRNCLLFHGPVVAATAFVSEPEFQSPTLWWPADRAWCVASELDIYSTYIASAPEAIQTLIDHPSIEALECAADQEIDPSPYPHPADGNG